MPRLGFACAAALLVAACSGAPNTTPAQTAVGTQAVSAPPTTAPTFAATPIPTNAAGIRTCVRVADSHGVFGIPQSMASVRLYLLRVAGSDTALVIEVDDAKDGGSDYGDGEDWYGAAQRVIDTIVFAR